MRQHFYFKKDTVFKLIHVFRLGCISVARREAEGVILQVIVHGIVDQGFAIKEESVWVSPSLASGSPILFATCALNIVTSPETPNLNAPANEAQTPHEAD